ncbi:hypothetical protein ACLESD_41275 [Pyxidicoccus sp. 3LFB2]
MRQYLLLDDNRAFAENLAEILRDEGDQATVVTSGDEAVRLAPHAGRSHLALGLVALKQRQEPVAKTALAKAVELEPTDGLAHLALADVLVRDAAELPRAVESYEAFLRLADGSPEAARVKKALPALKKKAAR